MAEGICGKIPSGCACLGIDDEPRTSALHTARERCGQFDDASAGPPVHVQITVETQALLSFRCLIKHVRQNQVLRSKYKFGSS